MKPNHSPELPRMSETGSGAKATLGVGALPGRKRPALYVVEGTVLRVLAYFIDETTMQRYMDFDVCFTPQEPKP